MSNFFAAGPCEIHVGVGSAGALLFLGYSEGGVRGEERAFYEDVKADILGPMSPTTVQQMGAEMFVSLDLRVRNEAVWELIQSRANGRVGTTVPNGFWPNGSIGALVPEENLSFRLLVFLPYALSHPFYVAAGMRAAYNLPLSYLAGPDTIDPIGVRAEKIRVVFRSIMQRNPATGDATLFNADYSGKPVPN